MNLLEHQKKMIINLIDKPISALKEIEKSKVWLTKDEFTELKSLIEGSELKHTSISTSEIISSEFLPLN